MKPMLAPSERATLVVSALACALVSLAVWAQSAEPRTVRDGVFSAAQVQRGQRVFNTICTHCHEIEEFTGLGAYLEEHEGKPLWETFDFVWSNMPDDDPSSLDPVDYAAVLAYIFSVYGLPTGNADMPIDRRLLEAITITRPSPAGG
jgi:mono/diheme cytochrome c family protein